jgi:stage V sporulation protein R
MEYERLSKSYAYGLHRIYEMVINTDPCYAYLLASNRMVDQKMVMAHVYGHVDFFKNNYWFAHTNRKMLDEMANHATRIRRHVERCGLEPVEDFIDACLSLDNLIDIHAAGIRRRPWQTGESEEQPGQVNCLPRNIWTLISIHLSSWRTSSGNWIRRAAAHTFSRAARARHPALLA